MNSVIILECIGDIDPVFIENAEAKLFKKRKINILWYAAAACVVMFFIGTVFLSRNGINPLRRMPEIPDIPVVVSPDPDNEDIPSDESQSILTALVAGQHEAQVVLSNGELNFITDIPGGMAPARIFLDPDTVYSEIWGLEQVIDYLGVDFRPPYLPDDLREPDEEPSWEVMFYNDGTRVPWTFGFTLTYQESFDDEYDPLRRALNITAAKGEFPFQCAIYVTETETPSNINGIEIAVGYVRMDYGPYTVTPPDEPNIPAGYYDVYIAEFMYEGIGYHVQSDNLTQEEFINVLLSIIR